ncbi:hypothetical protein HWQ46_10200 [Shewanella sp. D64]|uniref:hypothetical protein n=1 Tax=unclassified Shewanella TaxID=196818 RepID=UPI0022BA11F6|nr:MULTISPECIES: hypothetical protein [unclassified Shewanella]MEC4725916.1 hypothetical protein [Shewanella sp. D64]MEC4737171.1 hypothetical protein [Shewanella sp. E94]WBJ95637.1 hypothetical protein HWQ47_00435 [Shewanella sp. MTB7]
MIHISKIIALIDKQLKKLQPKEVVQFKTYKKDRGFIIYCFSSTEFQIVEVGFENASFVGDLAETRKQAKRCLDREFPRSNKVWVEYFQNVPSPYEVKGFNAEQMNLLIP